MLYLVTTSLPISSLVYSFSRSLQIGSIVLVPVASRKQIGLITQIVDLTYLANNNIPQDKVKSIIIAIEYTVDNHFIDFLNNLSLYTLQHFGDVIAASIGIFIELSTKTIAKNYLSQEYSLQEINLTSAQNIIASSIIKTLNYGFRVSLIDGVTGSGKTAVLLKVVTQVINQGKQALICLPEISLTSQVENFFYNKIGIKPLLWHSNITKSKKKVALESIITDNAKLIIGTRSSILLPFPNLGIIVIDEEHDQSYKQNENMIYSARDMAILRCKIYNIPIILSSATPSLESYVNAQNGKYNLYKLTERFSKIEMPQIEVVDMHSRQFGAKSGECISPKSLQIAQDVIKNDGQVLFFLNRRGFATSIMCGECKEFVQCNKCSVNMAYHASKNSLICHYCGHSLAMPNICNSCNTLDKFIKIGFAVERLKAELEQYFPSDAIQLFSSDEINSNNANKILEDISSGAKKIIVGTQMISKGFNFPKLKCVVIVDCDSNALDGDFRVYEKTFQLITQVAGRAGRFQERGIVLIQTHNPNNQAIKHIAKMDKEGFYALEIKNRNSKFNPLPPFTRQIAIIIASDNEDKAKNYATEIAKILHTKSSKEIKIFGPAPSLIKRVNNKFRYRIIITMPKTIHPQSIAHIIKEFPKKSGVLIKIDVDPINFM